MTKKRDADLRREIEADLELEEEEQRERGLSGKEAHYAALRAFGNPTLIREQTREAWSWGLVERLLRDLRISARTLLRSPGFSMIAVLVMALCIGATISLFTVVRSVMLRPLPFRDADKLVMVYEHFRDPAINAQEFNYNSVAPADFYDWRANTLRDGAHGFEDMAAWRMERFNLTGERGELPEEISARGGSWNLFPLLGVQAAIGRTFVESEDHPDGRAVMLTWNLYERRFGGDASIVGKQIHLNQKPYTVVGVLPKWFTYPDAKVQVWVPYASGIPQAVLLHHDFHFSRVIARLRPGVSVANALSPVAAVQYQIHMQNLHAPVAEDVVARTLTADLARDVTKPLIILVCAVGCMLLIGCLNVANLMVARSATRQKEIAIRSALGAQRMALIRAQLMESLLISITGGVCGVLLSLAATKWLVRTWKDLPNVQSIQIDGTVVLFACAIVIAAALLAGLLPAILSTGKGAMTALQGAMQSSSRSTAGSLSRTALRKVLLTVEIATTVVLLVAAGLLLKSFWLLRGTDVGAATDHMLTMNYTLPPEKYDAPEKMNAFHEALLDRVRSMPGVRAAGLGSDIPGAGPGEDDMFTIPEHPPIAAGASLPDAMLRAVDPGYFGALQIPLLSGRVFTKDDGVPHPDRSGQPDRPRTVVISHRLAQQYFPGEDAIGKHLVVGAFSQEKREIVGVVADTLQQVGKPTTATMYFPVLGEEHDGAVTLVVRTELDPMASSVAVQREIAKLDPEQAVANVQTMQEIVEDSLGNASLSASLVLAFAVLSLVLASIGLYGVLSYLMTQRTGEIGLRMALGAQREQVMRLMLGDGLRPAVYGLVVGLACSAGAVRLIQSMLYGTEPLDPVVFAAVAATLLIVASVACLIPAWRASRINPMQALRTE